MSIAVDKTIEEKIAYIAQEINLNPKQLVEEALKNFIKDYEQKKIEQLSDTIATRYSEMVTLKQNGIGLPDARDLLDEI